MELRDIDVTFDFTSDTKGFWDGFWERNDGLGSGGADPDSRSKTLRLYSQLLWSKPLPNGEVMELEDGRSKFYLKWKDFYFGNDSITASFRYYRNRPLLEEVKKHVPDYHQFVEDYLHQLYQIGGEVILPSAVGGINQTRGFRSDIRDRWDLTLECIRRYLICSWTSRVMWISFFSKTLSMRTILVSNYGWLLPCLLRTQSQRLLMNTLIS